MILLLALILILVAYYYDYRQNPKQFTNDVKGVGLFFLFVIAFVILLKFL